MLRQLWEQDRKQYELSKENIGLINIKCHDLRFRLQALRNSEGEVSREELEEIENAISIYDSRVSTGCEPLDTILTEKSLFCTKNGIRFTCMAEGSRLLFITPADLYSLLGNIISNAVEAVRKVEDPEYRVITLVVKPVGEMLLISEENYFSGSLEFQDGLPVTSKADKLEHGYGMKSIRMLTKKYGGDLRVNVKDDLFSLTLLFPLEKRVHGALFPYRRGSGRFLSSRWKADQRIKHSHTRIDFRVWLLSLPRSCRAFARSVRFLPGLDPSDPAAVLIGTAILPGTGAAGTVLAAVFSGAGASGAVRAARRTAGAGLPAVGTGALGAGGGVGGAAAARGGTGRGSTGAGHGARRRHGGRAAGRGIAGTGILARGLAVCAAGQAQGKDKGQGNGSKGFHR